MAGGFDVDEYYGELIVPLLADQPALDLLDIELSARYSDYSTFGGATKRQSQGAAINPWNRCCFAARLQKDSVRRASVSYSARPRRGL